jgi:hypothetical protein
MRESSKAAISTRQAEEKTMSRLGLARSAAPAVRAVLVLVVVDGFAVIPGTAANRVVLSEDFTATW